MFVRHAVENIPFGVVFMPILMAICSDIQIILRLLHQQFERGFNVGTTDGNDL
jgi:hypothetical protein